MSYFNFIKRFQPKVIQFGPIRSGSTLIYNLIRESYPNVNVIKRHNLKEYMIENKKIVATYRNPIDSLASSFKRYKLPVNEENIINEIERLENNGLLDLISVFDNEKILFLKYEEFYNDFDYAFDKIQMFLEYKIPPKRREKIKRKYNVDSVISITKKFDDFGEYDKKNHLHGNHVSETKGQPNTYQLLFNDEQLEIISIKLSSYLKKLGYTFDAQTRI